MTTTGYAFVASCPQCGDPLHHIADGAAKVLLSVAVAGCVRCDRSYLLKLTIAATTGGARAAIGLDHHDTTSPAEWNQAAPFAGLIADLMEAAP